jgi:hypothetical protein
MVVERIQRLAAEEARRAEVAAETPERVTTVEPLRETAEAEPVTGNVTTVTSPAEPEPRAEVEPLVEALAQAVARRHAMPTSPPLRPLGSAPPERMTARSQIRALLAVEDQPLYHRLIAERQAREAQALPAMTAD